MLKIIKHRDMEKFFSMKEMWFSMKQCGFLLWGGLCWESEDRLCGVIYVNLTYSEMSV